MRRGGWWKPRNKMSKRKYEDRKSADTLSKWMEEVAKKAENITSSSDSSDSSDSSESSESESDSDPELNEIKKMLKSVEEMDDSEEAEHSESKDGIVTILLGEETERNTKEPSETKENQAEGCIGNDRNKTNEFKVKEEERGEKSVVMSDKTGMSCRSWDFKRNAEVTESSDEKSMVGSDFDEGIAGRNTKDKDNDETDSR